MTGATPASPNCPYCGVPFAEMPKRSRKCPSCKQQVYIKYTPSNRTKGLVTEARAEEIDRLWSAHHNRQRSLQQLYPFDFGERELELWMSMGNTEAQAVDLLITGIATNCPNLHQKKMAHFYLASRADATGKPFRDHLVEACRCELLRLRDQRIKKVTVLTGGDSACSNCQALSGKVWEIETALAEMPLPHPQCLTTRDSGTPGYCTCTYVMDFSHLGGPQRKTEDKDEC